MQTWIYLQIDKEDSEDLKTYLRYKPMFESGEYFRDDIRELESYSAIVLCPECKKFCYLTTEYEYVDDYYGIYINDVNFQHSECGLKGICYLDTFKPVKLLNMERKFPCLLNLRDSYQIVYCYKMDIHKIRPR